MRRVSVLGATGSIGCSTLDLIARAPESYEVVALTGGRNVGLLAEQARTHRPQIVVTAHGECLSDLRDALAGTGIECAAGATAVEDAARRPAGWVMSAIVGMAGLQPGLAALEQGETLALANKESLVAAGPLLMQTARDFGARVLPVDSEHSAIFQALTGEDIDRVERIVLTASGGAFRDWPLETLVGATPDQAARHPNWEMGQRITIDSASLFNKAMELIETREYFGIDPSRIEVLVHPESVIHALVGFSDGAMMAHLGVPDMRHAIGYALHYPDRRELPIERLDLARLGQLSFRPAEEARWPALRLARDVMQAGGLTGAVFTAAKDRALDAFLARRIRFTDMAAVVEEALQAATADRLGNADFTLDTVQHAVRLGQTHADAAIAAL